MTDLATALADVSALTPFEGEPTLQAGIEIPGAAGGLREAMKIEPQEFHPDETLYVVLECQVEKVRHEPIKSDEVRLGWRRVHILKAERATFVDADVVEQHLADAADRIQRAKDAASGQGRLDDELLEAEMRALHAEGQHDAQPDARCPTCAEVAADA